MNSADDELVEPGTTSSTGKRYGWLYASDSELVWNNQTKMAGPIILNDDGEFNRYIRDAKDKVAKGQTILWQRLGKLQIEGAEIGRNTQLYHDERGEWLIAEAIDVTEDAEPKVRFAVKGSWPRRHITYYGESLENLLSEEVLRTKKDVNDETERLLEEFREGVED